MKPIKILCLTLILIFVFVLCLAGCNEKTKDFPIGVQTEPLLGEDGEALAAQKTEFDAQYIRTDCISGEESFPYVVSLHSVEELNNYYEDHKNILHLNKQFTDACSRYDVDYFDKNALVFVVLEEGSGSIRHNVESVKTDWNGTMYINIHSKVPETGSCDMAYWHIIIEAAKDKVPTDTQNIEVFYDDRSLNKEKNNNNEFDSFSFSLTWGVYGISSYDSSTGRLVKTKDATYPEKYVTSYFLTDEQKREIYGLIEALDIESYPDEYNPHGEGDSLPYMTLSLSVKTDGINKTVKVPRTVLSYDTKDEKGMKFLNTVNGITKLLTDTEEWKSLPDYEFFYD